MNNPYLGERVVLDMSVQTLAIGIDKGISWREFCIRRSCRHLVKSYLILLHTQGSFFNSVLDFAPWSFLYWILARLSVKVKFGNFCCQPVNFGLCFLVAGWFRGSLGGWQNRKVVSLLKVGSWPTKGPIFFLNMIILHAYYPNRPKYVNN